jgi:hypothetical protein
MNQQTLMLIEATGIQDYIFGSNQLAQNIGASELVRRATTDWVCELLPEPHNMKGDQFTGQSLGANKLAAEVVYAGGGNAMLLFADDDQAYQFAQMLTRRILEDAPGLQLVLKRGTFDPDKDVLSVLHQELRAELVQRKLDRDLSVPLPGLSVTAACVFTGAPAVAIREDRLISAEVRAKLNAEEDGKQRLKDQLPQIEQEGYQFIYDFNLFGTKGQSSYLAVIHTDGNSMGQRIQDIGQHYPTAADNGGYVKALREFSISVQRAAEKALTATVDMLLDPANLSGGKVGDVVPVPERDNTKYLPFRPIVFGGDDVTFVCEGRLGLQVAAKYLAEFAAQSLSDGKPAHARAGVAVVRSHYPFSRAYELAERLCQSAKAYIKDWEEEEEENGLTALDWHFAVSGLVLPLKEVRRREYTTDAVKKPDSGVEEGNLLMRPVRLSNPAGDWRSWENFTRLMAEFMKDEEEDGKWAGRRNKIKALRDALRGGPDAVRLFLYGETLPDIPQRPDMKIYGWQGGACGYFDVIEALDFFVPLKGGLAQCRSIV